MQAKWMYREKGKGSLQVFKVVTDSLATLDS